MLVKYLILKKKERINMENNFLKDLFNRQRYNEVIDILDNLYIDLFKDMLDYKNESYVNEENNFEYLDSLVRINYPQFSQDLIHLSVVRNEPNYTYLDIINSLLSTYMHLKDMYKNSEFENKYLECNENSGEDIVDDYEIIE